MKKLNILFLFSDQHNARCLSCAGHPEVQTPNLDRLAAEGVRFENAWAQNPICTPSRMSYLTGQYCSAHGYYGLYGQEPEAPLTSLFSWFRSQGYRTGALGKLHTPRYWIERECQFVYDEFLEFPKYLDGAGLFDRNDNRTFCGKRDGETSFLPFEESCESVLAKQFGRFLRQEFEPADRRKEGEPWFAWVSFSRPHQPYTPSEPFASMIPADKIELPPTSETESDALRNIREQHADRYGPFDEATLRKNVAAYLALVNQVDAGIGIVLDQLREAGQLDHTVIVYAADHGDHAGEHGMYEKKAGISARSICRVPLIIRAPDSFVSGRVSHEIVETVDLFPTLCELAGMNDPGTAQGKSLLPLLSETPQPVRESALTENRRRKAITTRQWRFVSNLEGERDELYDQENDPWELVNRIGDPSLQETVANLRKLLTNRLAEAAHPVTAFRGGWHGHRYDRDGRLAHDSVKNTVPYD